MFPVDRATSRQPRKWTPAEDQVLRAEVESQMVEGEVKDWCRIAAKLPGRTNKDCRKRWHNSVAGGLKKGQWARSEDLQLAKGVHKFGQRWTLVAEVVGSRSADQCAKRWQQSLDPELDRSEWRESEDRVLIQAVQELGRHWKDIQHLHFPGRSKNCIKNRYTVLLRRYQNQSAGSSHLPMGSPSLIPPSENSSIYGEDDSDTQSYAGNYALDGSSLRNSPAPLSTSGDSDLWMKPYPEWENDVQLANPHHFSNASLQPPSIASSNYWNWSDSSMPTVPASMNHTPFMDFELLGPNAAKQDNFFQLTPPAIQPLSTPVIPSSYALTAPMTAPTSAPLHRRAHSGFNSSPASPSLRAAALGAHLRRPNSANYTNNPPNAQSMAQFMAAMHHGNQSYGMR